MLAFSLLGLAWRPILCQRHVVARRRYKRQLRLVLPATACHPGLAAAHPQHPHASRQLALQAAKQEGIKQAPWAPAIRRLLGCQPPLPVSPGAAPCSLPAPAARQLTAIPAPATHRQQLGAEQEVEAAQGIAPLLAAPRLIHLAGPLQPLPRLLQLIFNNTGQQAVGACSRRCALDMQQWARVPCAPRQLCPQGCAPRPLPACPPASYLSA